MNTTDTPSDSQGGRRTYVVAAVLAALAGLLAYSSITQRRAEVERGWEPTPVLVAARDIPGGTVLDQDMLRVEAIPSRLVTPSIVRSDLLASVQDAKLLLPMKQGDLLNFNMLQGTQMSEALSQDLAKGVRALSLRVNVESSVNRMVRPNDHVDVLLTYRDPTTRTVTTQTLLENIVVLATGEIYGGTALGFVDDEARKYVTVTVELTPQEVELAVQAQSMGAIYMSLRHPDDPEVMEDRARTNVQTIMTGERADQLRNKRRKAPRLPQVLRGAGQ
ncbi:MAG: Flp pilus assembly protein CpaB [Myxococcota bacterium]|nr:Flp pilus assembly protein CpaB [Myxococcota bacterium]